MPGKDNVSFSSFNPKSAILGTKSILDSVVCHTLLHFNVNQCIVCEALKGLSLIGTGIPWNQFFFEK